MGQLVIEIPQNINLRFTVKSKEVADEILRLVKKPKKQLETITLEFPYDLEDIDENEVLGIWSDNEEEAYEIARKIREQNRKAT
jgi:1,2-phenylacetyl-CoA epoxidase catalytic subunit